MRISFFKDKFIAYLTPLERPEEITEAGFIWDNMFKRYVTTDYTIAEKLIKYCDENAVYNIMFNKKDVNAEQNIKDSYKVESNFKVFHPDTFKPFPFQIAGVEFMYKRDSVLLADQMGLGKTVQALLTMNMRTNVEALIVCPSILKYNWLKEARKTIIGELLAFVYEGKKIRYYKATLTPHKKKTILHIINYDILSKFKKRLKQIDFNFVVMDECFVYDTTVSTDKGDIKIGDIVEKKLDVKILSFNHSTGKSEYKPISRLIKHEVYDKNMIKINFSNGKELICTDNHKIFINGEYKKASEVVSGDNLFVLQSEINESEKRQNNSEEINNSAINLIGGVEFATTKYGVSNNNERSFYYVPFSSSLLQGGYSDTRIEDSNRGGRKFSQNEKMEVFGQEENRNIECVRVESVEVLERRDYERYRRGENQNLFLYDLEVSDNHNYYANNVLVSNCHNIKNQAAKRTKVAQELAKDIKYKIFITGTPIYNKPKDLYVVLNLIDPAMFNNFQVFAERYCGAEKVSIGIGGKKRVITKYDGANNLEELNRILRGNYMIRRMKEEVLKELPEKIKDVVVLDEDDLAGLVEKEKNAVANIKKQQDTLQEEVNKLRELAQGNKAYEDAYKDRVKKLRNVKMNGFGEIAKIRKEIAVKKMPYVVEFVKDILENSEDKQSKVVIFGHHQEVIYGLAELLKEYFPLVITGQTVDSERQKNIMIFKEKNPHRIFIGSMGAAGTGVDGLQNNCNIVVFAELDWTPALVQQAEDRLQRIGQKNTVWVYHIVANDSIDARIAKIMVQKENVAKQILDMKPEQLYSALV